MPHSESDTVAHKAVVSDLGENGPLLGRFDVDTEICLFTKGNVVRLLVHSIIP